MVFSSGRQEVICLGFVAHRLCGECLMARTVGSDGPSTDRAIMRAAVNLIARYGFHAVSLRQLAEEVGLQPASIYRYYASKNELLASVMKQHLLDLIGAWRDIEGKTSDPLSRLD